MYLETEVFNYIQMLVNDLQVNVFGCVPYLVEEFNISKKEARELLTKYLKK